MESMVLRAGSLLILLLMFLLPFFSVSGYSIIRNTVRELGAQFSPHAQIINFTFVFLAIGSVIAGWAVFEGCILHRILLVVFGISLTLIAFFNHAPVDTHVRYNLTEAGYHEYFACTALFSFIILTIATSFIMERQHERAIALSTGLSALVLSVLITESDQLAGVWERLLFIISFGWMIYNFKTCKY